MIARRSWRSFDPVLFGALLALSAFGAVMVYSATIATPGLEGTARRQIIFVLIGVASLLFTASVDYRLLELVQHPLTALPPVVLMLAGAGLAVSLRATQIRAAEQTFTLAALRPDLPALVLGAVLLALVFVLDRKWVKKLDSALVRGGAAGLLLSLTAGTAVLLLRSGPARLDLLKTYGVPAGLALLYLLDRLTLRFTDLLRNPLYVVTLGMLGLTLVVGRVSGGAQSWLGAGTVQPSELAKVLVILILAEFLAEREQQLEHFGTVLVSILVMALPMLLIYFQPDLGTAITLMPIWACMMWMAGVRLRHLLILATAGVAALPLAWFGMQDYMRSRLLLFVNPAGDPDAYFNVHQALVSVGSGGWFGKGLTHGTQSQLHFLRVRHTDFIFAVTAEELGFVGSVALMALIVLVVWRMLRVAERSRDTFGRLIAAGVAAIVLFQSVINIGMNLGLLPVTGLPLPFVSYGGSSLLTLMLGAGLVEGVAMRRKKLEFD